MKLFFLSTFVAFFTISPASANTLNPTKNSYRWLQFGFENYANEKSTIQERVDFEWNSLSDAKVNQSHRSQFHFNFFYETGPYGDRSIDPDIFVWRYSLGSSSHLWLGRSHALTEGLEGEKISSTSAIGANWLQNQANALEPNVVGWIGSGVHSKKDSFFFTAAATPLYFPNFGPRTDLSEDSDAGGSRFARLPPQYVRINNNLVPLRFHIDTGNILKIVFQPQALLSFGWDGHTALLRFATWYSPTLNPEVDTSEVLRIQNNDLNVLVTAKPKFPRETFFAFSAQEKFLGIGARFESVFERRTQRLSLSQSFAPAEAISFGALHTFYQPQSNDSGVPETPKYDKYLVWGELAAHRGKFRPSIRAEHHFTKDREDSWLQAKARYLLSESFSLSTKVSLLAGADLSYFGTWRSFDSLHLGANYLW